MDTQECQIVRWIGGKHTALDNIPKGFPPHVRNVQITYGERKNTD